MCFDRWCVNGIVVNCDGVLGVMMEWSIGMDSGVLGGESY